MWSQVFICVGCHILFLANHVTSEWMDVIVCPTHHLSPFRYPLECRWGWNHLIVRSVIYVVADTLQLTGLSQDFTCIVLGGVELELVLSHHLPPWLFYRLFPGSLLSFCQVLVWSSLCVVFWNSYVKMSWFLQYQRRDKKLNLHVGELEMEWADHLHPVAANLMGNHKWRLYGMPTPTINSIIIV
jgi:hypothetical protein